jgi:protein-disulfide isomerase
MIVSRRKFIGTGAALAALRAMPALAEEGDFIDLGKLMAPAGIADRFLGPADAKVTVLEYASPTCPHCAAFHMETYPSLKANYIDTGKIRFAIRPFVRNVPDAVVFLLANAAPGERYFDLLGAYFKTQDQWTTSATPKDALQAVALQYGFSAESFEAALKDQASFDAMEKARDQAVNDFHLTGTPTFYINGKHKTGVLKLTDLAAEIDPLLV